PSPTLPPQAEGGREKTPFDTSYLAAVVAAAFGVERDRLAVRPHEVGGEEPIEAIGQLAWVARRAAACTGGGAAEHHDGVAEELVGALRAERTDAAPTGLALPEGRDL